MNRYKHTLPTVKKISDFLSRARGNGALSDGCGN